ncbi:ATP-grasp domain-containing protein [Phytomonospora endophytica]|uniref:Biotin carboxylase n=1 Tax=Phytomonospora endophytica TaxID=714109 RepID=A0A841FZ68_9ACTN|nr:ATP-grasp domain-containing protein [Phytomonospora endophytica]MBB6040033.1 biotin carboxylase [Phytomonospora endophytica]GIG71594.1 argininosuccinate lyase [Phytomonospora endophytica]
MSVEWLILVESNTTGSGRLFCSRARDIGLRPVVFTHRPDRYPYLRTDGIDTRTVDTTDPEALLLAIAALVEEEGGRAAGVTSSSEYFIAAASTLAHRLGLPHADAEAIRACRDKVTQRTLLSRGGMPGPRFAAAATPAEAASAASHIGLPVVVKPRTGSGSIGVRICRSLPDVEAAVSAILEADTAGLALPTQSSVLVEEYLDGLEYSVEVLDTTVVGVTRKHLGPEPHFVEIGHDFPAALDALEREAICDAALEALRVLGLGWGPAHVELRRTPDGYRIVEVNPRLAGGMIPRVVEEACGIDMVQHVVAKAVGRETTPRPTRARSASIRFLLAGRPGRLAEVGGVERARLVPGVTEVCASWEPGYDVTIRNSFQDRAAHVIAAADDGRAAALASASGLAALVIRFADDGHPEHPTTPADRGTTSYVRSP